MIVLDLSILNQKGTPMFNSDLTANRPAAGIVGRIFIAIDSPYGIFRDTGTAWDQISSAGGGATIYTGDGTLTGTRTISSGGFQLVINPQTTFFSSLIPSTSASSFSVLGSNTLTFAAGFSSSNIGNVYSANGAINAQIFSGNATFAQANLASAMVNVNKIDFGSGGHTITMTQSTAPGIRAMTGVQNQIQFTGSHNGTISHAAVSQNLGFFRDTGSTRTLTITNAYSHLINPLDDYGSGFTFTNRWGIYQAGTSDKNYFAANVLIGSTTDAGQKLQVSGLVYVNNSTQGFSASNASIGTEGGIYAALLSQFGASIYLTNNFTNTSGFSTGILVVGSSSNTTITSVRGSIIAIPNLTATSITGTEVVALQLQGNFTKGSGTTVTYAKVLDLSSVTGGVNNTILTLSNTTTLNQQTGNWAIYNASTYDSYYAGTISIGSTSNTTDWLNIAASTTAKAQIFLAAGTAPTSPSNGDIWFDGTNLFMRIGGLTKTFTII
jgi:hypothetical protein